MSPSSIRTHTKATLGGRNQPHVVAAVRPVRPECAGTYSIECNRRNPRATDYVWQREMGNTESPATVGFAVCHTHPTTPPTIFGPGPHLTARTSGTPLFPSNCEAPQEESPRVQPFHQLGQPDWRHFHRFDANECHKVHQQFKSQHRAQINAELAERSW